MTRIVLKNGEIIETETDLLEVCEYITINNTKNGGKIYLFNTNRTAEVIEINDIKSIESI